MAIYEEIENEWGHNPHSNELKETINATYREKYGKSPGSATSKAIDCVDDAFLGEWRKELNGKDEEMKKELIVLKNQAENTITALQQMIKSSQELGIKDERVSDALRAYLSIVTMKFKYPDEELQNIKNASYFIWAVYANNSSDSAEVFASLNQDEEACE